MSHHVMNCPVCDSQISFAGYDVCRHHISDGAKYPEYTILYSLRYNRVAGETVVIPYFGFTPIMTMTGFHILTVERIEKLLLLQ